MKIVFKNSRKIIGKHHQSKAEGNFEDIWENFKIILRKFWKNLNSRQVLKKNL